VQLTRRRTPESVELLRHELTDAESTEFLFEAHKRLQKLRNALTAQQFHIIGQVPPEENVVGRVCEWLTKLSAEISLADSPKLI
jgi:cobalamin biosynthesis Mg chelatase CobN